MLNAKMYVVGAKNHYFLSVKNWSQLAKIVWANFVIVFSSSGGGGWGGSGGPYAPGLAVLRDGHSWGAWVGLGVCAPPVLTDPEAPSPEVLWQTCQVVSGSPALDSGLQCHRRPWCALCATCACTAMHGDEHNAFAEAMYVPKMRRWCLNVSCFPLPPTLPELQTGTLPVFGPPPPSHTTPDLKPQFSPPCPPASPVFAFRVYPFTGTSSPLLLSHPLQPHPPLDGRGTDRQRLGHKLGLRFWGGGDG